MRFGVYRDNGGARSLETKSWVADVGRKVTGVAAGSAPTRSWKPSPGQPKGKGDLARRVSSRVKHAEGEHGTTVGDGRSGARERIRRVNPEPGLAAVERVRVGDDTGEPAHARATCRQRLVRWRPGPGVASALAMRIASRYDGRRRAFRLASEPHLRVGGRRENEALDGREGPSREPSEPPETGASGASERGAPSGGRSVPRPRSRGVEEARRRVDAPAGRRSGDGSVVTKTSEEGEVEESGRDSGLTGPSRTPWRARRDLGRDGAGPCRDDVDRHRAGLPPEDEPFRGSVLPTPSRSRGRYRGQVSPVREAAQAAEPRDRKSVV